MNRRLLSMSPIAFAFLVLACADKSADLTGLQQSGSGAGATTIATVRVNLPATSLSVGQTTQATATLFDENNNIITGPDISWSSSNVTNAAIDQNGIVKAVSSGSATITASAEGKSASASVVVEDAGSTPPPSSDPPPPPPSDPPPPPSSPPSSGSSSEPTGMSALYENAFSSLSVDGILTGMTIAQDASAPKSPSGVLRTTFASGFAGGASPGNLEISHSGRRVLYVSYWAKLSSNFTGHSTGINKQFYEWADGKPVFYFEAFGGGNGSLMPRVVLQGTPRDAVYSPNLVSGAKIPRGQWYHMEVLLTGNTSGAANGAVDWWLDGVHVGSITSGIQFTSGTTSWSIFSFRPIWGGLGDTVPSTMTLDLDHLYVSGKN